MATKPIENLTAPEQATFRSEIGVNAENVLALLEGKHPSNMEGMFINAEYPGNGLTGLVADGATDNTTRLQAIVNFIAATNQNGTIYFPSQGVYLFSGGLQDTARRNAQILLPIREHNQPCITIKFLGASKFSFSPQTAFSPVPLPPGTVLKTTLNSGAISADGVEPSFIGGKAATNVVNFGTTYLHIHWENLILQLPSNPVLSGLNFNNVSNVTIKNSIVVAGTSISILDVVEPTTTFSYGIIMPRFSSGISQRLEEDVTVWNLYTGIRLGENSFADEPFVAGCIIGYEFATSYGQSRMRRPAVYWCKYGGRFLGKCRISVEHWESERGPTGYWNSWVADIHDTSNLGIGTINWHTNELAAPAGTEHRFKVLGGSNLFVPEMGVPGYCALRLAASFFCTNIGDSILPFVTIQDGRDFWNPATSKFVVPNTGVYEICINYRFVALTATGRIFGGIKRNGAWYGITEIDAVVGTFASLVGTFKLPLTSDDEVTFCVGMTLANGQWMDVSSPAYTNGFATISYVSQVSIDV